jgi:sigma-E factor negative regulatory protein RseA
MKEKLSALIDGELQSDSLHAHLGRLRADPELRGAWDTYHLIGDALRGQVGPRISDRVVARLREEPTVLAPRPKKSTSRRFGWCDERSRERRSGGSRRVDASRLAR